MRKKNRKQDDDSDGIVQLHLAVDKSDDDDVNEHKSTATVEAVGTQESPSVDTEGSNGQENPGDDDAPTQQEHCVGVLMGCDNDATYIPTSEEVYYSIDQDRLFADDDDDSAIGDDLPAFLGLTVTGGDSSVGSSSDESFDTTNELNILLHALYRAARAQNKTMAGAESWFEAVSAKFAISGIRDALVYIEMYSTSGPRGINELLTTSGYTPMYVKTLMMINNTIVDIKSGRDAALPVIFNGLPRDEDLITGLSNEQQDLYEIFLEAARRLRRYRPTHWANRNFQKAQVIGLDTYRHASAEIVNDHWNFLLQNAGQPTLHDISMQAVKGAISDGIRNHDNSHPDDNPDF